MENNRENKSRAKKPGHGRLLYIIILAVCAAAFCFSVFMLIKNFSEDEEVRDFQEEISEAATSAEASGNAQIQVVDPLTGADTAATEEYQASDVNFESLWEINKDVVGWIKLPDTIIDYPIAQGESNDTYLRTLLNGEHHRFGTLFIDYENTADFSDFNTIIYGHNIKAGDMFHIVEFYRNQEYYDEHPYFILYLPDGGVYKLEPYSCRYVPDTYFMPQRCYGDIEKYKEFIELCKSKSLIETDTEMDENYKTVTLFTCSSDADDERFLLHCKMSPYS